MNKIKLTRVIDYIRHPFGEIFLRQHEYSHKVDSFVNLLIDREIAPSESRSNISVFHVDGVDVGLWTHPMSLPCSYGNTEFIIKEGKLVSETRLGCSIRTANRLKKYLDRLASEPGKIKTEQELTNLMQ